MLRLPLKEEVRILNEKILAVEEALQDQRTQGVALKCPHGLFHMREHLDFLQHLLAEGVS